MKKHLIHVGFPKSGSTYLQEWFNRHPQIHHRNGALAGYYNINDIVMNAVDPAWNEFPSHVTSLESLIMPHGGEIAKLLEVPYVPEVPLAIAQKQACQTLKSLFPNAKVLIVTRGFQQMMLSSFSEYAKMGGLLSLPQMCHDFVAAGGHNYDYVIEIYKSVFGEENTIILPYEMLRDDQEKFIRTIETELGIKHYETKIGKLNPSLNPQELYWCQRMYKALYKLKKPLGNKTYRLIHALVALSTLKGKTHILFKLQKRLKPNYQIDNSQFPEIILEQCRGKANSLKDNVFYAAYHQEYLFD